MQKDNFRNWGFVLYRFTYKSDSDWEEFMRRYLDAVRSRLESANGLDLLNSFAPTILEDRRFDGASSFTIRDHFEQWVTTAAPAEQGISTEDLRFKEGGRYKFCLMVDEEALQSILNVPLDRGYQDTGYVILVDGEWKPEEELDEEEKAMYEVWEPEVFEPVDGCTEKDVGCMRVRYDVAQVSGYVDMRNRWDWEVEYRRPPEIA